MRILLAARTRTTKCTANKRYFRLLHVNIWCGMIFVIRSITAECHVCAVDLADNTSIDTALYTFLTLFTQNAAEIILLNFIKNNSHTHSHIRETKIVACFESYKSQPTGMILHTYRCRYCIWSTNIFMPFQSLFSLWFICSGESFGTGLFAAQTLSNHIHYTHRIYIYKFMFVHACVRSCLRESQLICKVNCLRCQKNCVNHLISQSISIAEWRTFSFW